MPYEIKKTPSCPANKPFGVFNKDTGDLRNRCHASRAKALAQMRALYAAESGKMSSEAAVVNLVKSFSDEWMDGNRKWIKVYPFSSWSHPIFSDTMIDEEAAKILKDSFDQKLFGEQDYSVTYDHGLDPAKGGKAAGWYEQLEVRDDGLWGLVRFTDVAREEIDAGEWRYFSGEHWDEWKNPHTGEVHSLVFSGGALTNKPYVKEGMVPLNFSDVFVEKEFTDWSTAYKNNLPDSAFLYIEKGGSKDSEGKTTPRSLRHFPVRDSNGKVDLIHVRNAISQAPKAKDKNGNSLSESIVSSVQSKARKLLGSKSMSDVVNEAVPEEHADPGEQQRTDDNDPDKAADSGSRVDSPPEEAVSIENKLDERLREVLGLDPDTDIIKAAEDLVAEVKPFREAAKEHSERKTFADVYPEQAAELERLRKRDVDARAKEFSDRFRNIPDDDGKPSGKGYPSVVIDKLTEVHKKFSDGQGTILELAEVVELIGKSGLVEYEEAGSSRTKTFDDDESSTPQKQFADRVVEIMESDNLDHKAAMRIAIERYPDLHEQYQRSIPGRR